MALETKHNLEERTIDKLQELIRINIDSYDGFNEAAEKVDDANLSAMFREIARERSEMASALQQFVEFNGEAPVEEGSLAATMHRLWIDFRAMLNGGDQTAILEEAERGEDQIKQAYENVLKETAGSAMNDVLQHQYACIKKRHDAVRDLRDQHRALRKKG